MRRERVARRKRTISIYDLISPFHKANGILAHVAVCVCVCVRRCVQRKNLTDRHKSGGENESCNTKKKKNNK